MDPTNYEELERRLREMPKRITRKAAASMLDVSMRTMEEWHKKGIGPKAVKHGVRGVRYFDTEVIACLNERVVKCT